MRPFRYRHSSDGNGNGPAIAMTLDDAGTVQSGEGLAEALISHVQACTQLGTWQRMPLEHEGIDDSLVEQGMCTITRRIVRVRGLGEFEMDVVLADEQQAEWIGRRRAAVLNAQ